MEAHFDVPDGERELFSESTYEYGSRVGVWRLLDRYRVAPTVFASFQDVAGRPLLIVPYSLDINDIKFVKGQHFTTADFAEYAIDSFDTLYGESAGAPRMMSIGLRVRLIGRPGRLPGLERLLAHASRHARVWWAGRDRIATCWATRYAPPGTWNWPSAP